MGFIKAFSGALGGAFADQWLDFLTVPTEISPSAAFFPAFGVGTNAGRGSNTKASENIISDGSLIVVPVGYALITFNNGKITGFISEPGGYRYTTDDPNAQSFFHDPSLSQTVKNTWERFKFGGIPGSEHRAFYVNLKEIPNNRFGTQSEIYWDDAYLNAQVGAITRGTYTLRIVDPILFVTSILPATYYTGEAKPFDFSDLDNPVAGQLFNEVVSCLAPAFSKYTNDPDKNHRINTIQSDSLGFAQSLSAAVEEGYQWKSARGLIIEKVALTAIEYDADTRKLLSDVQKADALAGARGNSFLQQAAARGVQAAGENGGGAGLAMFGMGAGGIGLGSLQQPVPGVGAGGQAGFGGQAVLGGAATTEVPNAAMPTGGGAAVSQPQMPADAAGTGAPPTAGASTSVDPIQKMTEFKQMLDAGLITQEDFDAAKNKLLGL